MTPDERKLVTDLFERLATLEQTPRDPEAERLILDGLRRVPNATYALVQSVLVQDEALRSADERIRVLEADLGIQPEPPRGGGGFLDNMRDTFFGRQDERRGSVPNVRPGEVRPGEGRWGEGRPGEATMGASRGFGAGAQPMPEAPQSRGGSFLGTAAAAAAGVVGGSLLLDSFRSMTGNRGGGQGLTDSAAAKESPWGGNAGGNAGGGDLSRQAGTDQIGRGDAQSNAQGDQRQGAFDSNAAEEASYSDDDFVDEDAGDFDDDH